MESDGSLCDRVNKIVTDGFLFLSQGGILYEISCSPRFQQAI